MHRGEYLRIAGRFLGDRSGAAMVEFAIVAFVFVPVLLFGILEFGFAAWSKNMVASDAREGARYAVVHGSYSPSPATPATIRSYLLTKTSLDTFRVTTTWSPINKDPGSVVTVRVFHDRPRRGIFLPTTTDSSTSKMVVVF